MSKHDKDFLQRFIFEQDNIRGEYVRLDDSWMDILHNQRHPPLVEHYLAQMMSATVLLAAIIKIDGSISIQASGDGLLNLFLTECRRDLSIRAIAKYNQEKLNDYLSRTPPDEQAGFDRLFNHGTMVITVQQQNGHRYQGIVDMQGDDLAHILENHLAVSEQIKTRLFLTHEDTHSAGLLLQEMPSQQHKTSQWDEISLLAGTVKNEEMLDLELPELLKRLFHEHDIRLFEAQAIHFSCTCSQEKVSRMLLSLDYQEAQEIVEKSEYLEVACEFCGKTYRFDEMAIAEIFSPKQNPDTKRQYH